MHYTLIGHYISRNDLNRYINHTVSNTQSAPAGNAKIEGNRVILIGTICMKPIVRKLLLIITTLAGSAILITVGVAFYIQLNNFKADHVWVDHTYNTIEKASQLLNDITHADNDVQGYLISGNQNNISEYYNNLTLAFNKMGEFKQLVNDNQEQSTRVESLQNMLSTRASEINFIISQRQHYNATDALKNINKTLSFDGTNILLTKQISNQINTIINEEKKLLLNRRHSAYNYFIFSFNTGFIVIIISMSIILLCLILLNHQLHIRHQTEKKLQQTKHDLEKLAYYDSLTGLNNRVGLIGKIKELINQSKNDFYSIALLYLDLDNFKNINDNYGHNVGDILLQNVSSRLREIPYDDKFLARISGDEFVILLPYISDRQSIDFISQHIIDSITQPITINNQSIISTVSIGICTYPQDAQDESALLKNADIALYRAKQLGKNNFQYCTNEIRNAFEKNAILSQNLRQALINKEFTLMYQPKMSLITEQPTGVEALIRWNRPNVGLTLPNDFIGFAENNGLIIPIGEWMLRTVCEQAKSWSQLGLNIHNVAINVSTREFIVRDFVRIVTDILDELSFDPSKLEIEITESILIDNSTSNINALNYLKSLGIKITLDDFGTGYSSLSYLNILPVDKLKIDKSFISKITSHDHSPNIVRAIISMAHSLGIKVVAEGVENQLQADFLRYHKCDELQGYHYSKPLSADELHRFYVNQA